MNKNKYHNSKVIYNGIKFDSKKEMERYKELIELVNKGFIKELELQKKFILQEDYIKKNGKKIRPIIYIADFAYLNNVTKEYVVEDVKGYRTEIYKLKKKIFEYIYKIDIKEL